MSGKKLESRVGSEVSFLEQMAAEVPPNDTSGKRQLLRHCSALIEAQDRRLLEVEGIQERLVHATCGLLNFMEPMDRAAENVRAVLYGEDSSFTPFGRLGGSSKKEGD